MRVFQIKGFSGLVMFLLAVLALVAVVVLFPTAFLMVLWNAVVFEGFQGPEIAFHQAFLLWGASFILFKLIFKPQISFQFHRVNDPKEAEKKMHELKNHENKE